MELKTIKYNNIFSFKKFFLDMSNTSFALVQGKNGSGKSYMWDALFWVMFGSIPRKNYKRVLRDIPDKPKSGYGKIVFTDEGNEYEIIRRVGKGKGLEFKVNGDDKTLRTPTYTQQSIQDALGFDMSTFLNIAYFSQGDIGKFLNSDSSQRIELTSNIIGSGELMRLKKSTSQDLKLLSSKVSGEQGKVDAYRSLLSEMDIEVSKASRRRMKKEISDIKERYRELQDKIAKMEIVQSLVEDEENIISKMKTEQKAMKKELSDTTSEIRNIKDSIKQFQDVEELKETERVLLEEKKGLLPSKNKLEERRADLIRVTKSVERMKNSVSSIKKSIQSLESLYSMKGGACPTCRGLVGEEHIKNMKGLVESHKNNLERVKKALGREEKSLGDISSEISYLEGDEDRINEIGDEVYSIQKKINRQADQNSKLERLKSKRVDIKSKYSDFIENMKSDISVIRKKIRAQGKVEECDFDKLLLERDELWDSLQDMNRQYNELSYKIQTYYDNQKQLKLYEGVLGESLSEYSVVKYWDDNIPRIKADLISMATPHIETCANEFLNKILPEHSIEFKVDPYKAMDKMDVVITDNTNNISRPIEGWSGGERDKMSLAVYIALNHLSYIRNKKSVDFIILDEKLVGIDADSRSTILDAIRSEFKNRKVIFISHLQNIESEFDQVITVKKTDGITTYTMN